MDPTAFLSVVALFVTISGGIASAVYFIRKDPESAKPVIAITGMVMLLLLAVIGGIALVRASSGTSNPTGSSSPTPTATTSSRPTTTLAPTSATTPTLPAVTPGPPPYAEQEGPLGVNTFTDPHNASGMGQKIAAGTQVQVTCKLYDPTIPSVNPDGYWYLIASSPWNNAYYAPANTFMNGDPWGGPYTHNTDWSVRDC